MKELNDILNEKFNEYKYKRITLNMLFINIVNNN